MTTIMLTIQLEPLWIVYCPTQLEVTPICVGKCKYNVLLTDCETTIREKKHADKHTNKTNLKHMKSLFPKPLTSSPTCYSFS